MMHFRRSSFEGAQGFQTSRRYNKKLTQEERERRAGGLFVEYTGSRDVAEALLSTQELAAPGFLPKLVRRAALRYLSG